MNACRRATQVVAGLGVAVCLALLLAASCENEGGILGERPAFRGTGAGLTGVSCGCSLAWGDYDSDGDLDLALAGYSSSGRVSKVYRNDWNAPNALPSAPTDLAAVVNGSQVTFSWTAATDTPTPQAGLSYNLRVGTTSGGNEVFSGMADVGSGWRRVPARGVAQPGVSTDEWTLTLPAGTYYWSVQAIDTAFAGGAWAAEETVTVP